MGKPSEETKYASSRQLVPVHAVIPETRPEQGAMMIMKDGSFRTIIESGAVNFDMKNPMDRAGLTTAFGALTDSLEVGFPIQIVSHSKLLDVEVYIQQFESRLENDRVPDAIKEMIEAHLDHFRQSVQRNHILSRNLYIVIPWKGTDHQQKSTADEVPFLSLFKGLSREVEEREDSVIRPDDLEISAARNQLEMRTNQIRSRLKAMGIWSRALNEDEVRKLLYSYFHPGLSERQRNPGVDSQSSIALGFSSYGLPQKQARIGGGGH